MKLRGHHLLCIFGWRGFGYNAEFSRKMDEVSTAVKSSNPEITVIAQADDICGSCPNVNQNGCYKHQNDRESIIQAHDGRVLKFLRIDPGSKIRARTLRKLIGQRKAYKNLDFLCKDCSWLDKGYCNEGLMQLATSNWQL